MKKKIGVACACSIALVTTVALADQFEMENQTSGFPAWSGEADWALGFYKGECPSNEAMIGVSRDPNNAPFLHDVDCAPTAVSHVNETGTFAITASNNCLASDCTGANDWDVNYYKFECPFKDELVGMSQDTSSGALHSYECTPISLEPINMGACHTYEVAGPDSNCGASCTGSNDWDLGYYKGQCAADEVATGISVDTSDFGAHDLRCCTFSLFIP